MVREMTRSDIYRKISVQHVNKCMNKRKLYEWGKIFKDGCTRVLSICSGRISIVIYVEIKSKSICISRTTKVEHWWNWNEVHGNTRCRNGWRLNRKSFILLESGTLWMRIKCQRRKLRRKWDMSEHCTIISSKLIIKWVLMFNLIFHITV
jgi:hypothetical protein